MMNPVLFQKYGSRKLEPKMKGLWTATCYTLTIREMLLSNSTMTMGSMLNTIPPDITDFFGGNDNKQSNRISKMSNKLKIKEQ